jgi:hypothetical protein
MFSRALLWMKMPSLPFHFPSGEGINRVELMASMGKGERQVKATILLKIKIPRSLPLFLINLKMTFLL